jgi:hypothetical protein
MKSENVNSISSKGIVRGSSSLGINPSILSENSVLGMVHVFYESHQNTIIIPVLFLLPECRRS